MANLGIQNNNPGNLRDPNTGNFQVFKTPEEGHQALLKDITLKQSGQSSHIKPGASIEDLGNVWAPPSDNNVKGNWASNVAKFLGINTAEAFDSVPPEKLAEAIKVAEGTSSMKNTSQGSNQQNSGQLSHDKLIANINSMEQQGAKPDEIQGYLDSLKGKTQNQGFNPKPFSNPSGGSGVGSIDYSGTNTDTTTTKPTDPNSLGGELANRGTEATNAINSIVGGEKTGSSRISGVLQLGGAAAGALGDVVNKGLELIPGVKQVENLLGQGIGALAKTNAGQAVVKSIQDFSTAHPELAKDIGAGFNIVTAIPILKGLGVVGKLGMEAGSQALKGIAEKSFIEGAPDLIASTKTGARFLEQNPGVTKDMIDRRLVGDIKGGEYVTKDAINTSSKTVGDLNKQVQTIFEKPEYSQLGQDGNSVAQKAIDGFTDRNGNVIQGFPNSGMTPSELIANAKKLDPTNKLLWDKFEAGQANWKEINKLRSALDGKVKKVFIQGASLDTPEIATSKELGAGLSGAMRDTLQSTITETQPLFKEMTTQFNIQKALGYMDGKTVKPGGLAKFVGHATGAGAGGVVGGMIGGAPGAMVGGMIGDRTAGTISNALAGRNMVQGVLKRTGVNALKVSKKEMLKKLPGLFSGAVNVK